jgi:hypothetical protein
VPLGKLGFSITEPPKLIRIYEEMEKLAAFEGKNLGISLQYNFQRLFLRLLKIKKSWQ